MSSFENENLPLACLFTCVPFLYFDFGSNDFNQKSILGSVVGLGLNVIIIAINCHDFLKVVGVNSGIPMT